MEPRFNVRYQQRIPAAACMVGLNTDGFPEVILATYNWQ